MSFVEEAKKTLENGGIILYPTDTVYPFGVDALNTKAIKRLKELKGRTDSSPITVIVPSLEEAEKYVEVNDLARKLAKKFLPGPLTLVLSKKDIIPDELTADKDSLGIRIPKHKFCLELAREFGRPYTTTSANVSGQETKQSVPEILEQFGEKAKMIDYIVDIGPLPESKPSTVVDASSGKIEIVREGVIPSEEILRVDRN